MFLLPVVVSELHETHTTCGRFKAGFYKRFGASREYFVGKSRNLLRAVDYATHFEAFFKG
jgi:hypothetical protein